MNYTQQVMITIFEATPNDFETIQQIVHAAWPIAYGKILTKDQIDFMLESMYSISVLNDNYTNKNHRFLLLNESGNPVGFASYEHHYSNSNTTRLHKLYFLPSEKRKGFGKLLVQKVVKIAKENHSDKITLNVNRFNTATHFYQKMGFEIVAEENLFIGNGYFMDDYKIEKKL